MGLKDRTGQLAWDILNLPPAKFSSQVLKLLLLTLNATQLFISVTKHLGDQRFILIQSFRDLRPWPNGPTAPGQWCPLWRQGVDICSPVFLGFHHLPVTPQAGESCQPIGLMGCAESRF